MKQSKTRKRLKRAPYFLGQRLLVVTAHPDDESYAAGAVLASNKKYGGTTMVICATLGEKGSSHLKRPLSAVTLKALRKRELRRAAAVLGITSVVTLTVPDGKVKAFQSPLFRRYLVLARRFQPEAILGFDETGITGHWDHIAIGRVGVRVARELHVPYYAFCLPPRLFPQAARWLKARRRAPHYSNTPRFKKPDVRIPIDPAVKKRAIRAHASQLDSPRVYSGYPAWAVKELLRAEYFRKLR